MIEFFKKEIKKLLNNETKFFVLLLILFGAFTYLPQISKLGFYNEDWYILWARKFFGPEKIIDMHLIDRPLMGVHHALMNLVFGDTAIFYHIYIMILRIVGAILVFFIINKVLSGKKEEGFYGGLIFLVFPGFLAQPVAMTHTSYLLAFNLIAISMLISLYDVVDIKKSKQVFLLSFSILAMMSGYLIMEWFIGLEVCRIILIGYSIWHEYGSNKKVVFFKTLKRYLPYFLFVALFLVWRVFFFTSGRQTTDLRLILGNYVSNPLDAILSIGTTFTQNLLNTLFSSWVAPLYRLLNLSTSREILVAVFWSLLGIILLAIVLKSKNSVSEISKRKSSGIIIIGLLLVVFSGLILAGTGRTIYFENLNNKYILPSVLGISFIAVGVIRSIPTNKWRVIAVSVAIFLSVITNSLNVSYYRNFWNIEKSLWWQLSWRTPDVQESTVILPILPSGFGLIDNYEIWPQADLIYGREKDPLWAMGEVVNSETLGVILNQATYGRTIKRIPTVIDLKNALVLSLPSNPGCLKVGNETNLLFSAGTLPLARIISPISRVDLLNVDDTDWKIPPTSVFGNDPEHTWCYFYQKSELALQRLNWKELTENIDRALELGYSPADSSEWVPAYIGYAYTGQTDMTNEIGGYLRSDPEFVNLFCSDDQEYSFGGDEKIDHFLYMNICGEEKSE